MELNSLIFPHGTSSYTAKSLAGNLLYIPRHNQDESPNRIPKMAKTKPLPTNNNDYIPCLYLPYHLGSNKTLIYFHGNSEDLGQVVDLLIYIRAALSINIVAMEYPTYGIYKAKECSELQILEDAVTIYDYFTLHVGVDQDDIFIFGRSIGTGPAAYIASKYDPAVLILMSGFTSIRAVVREAAGKLFQYIIKERFNNIARMHNVSCPTLIIHGMHDDIINYHQSVELSNICKANGIKTKLVTPDKMTHVEMDFEDDFISPLMLFLKDCNINIKCEKNVSQSDIIRKSFSFISK